MYEVGNVQIIKKENKKLLKTFDRLTYDSYRIMWHFSDTHHRYINL